MTTTFAFDPEGGESIHRLVSSLNHPVRGIIAFAAQPGARRDLWLFHSLLDALEKSAGERHLLDRARTHGDVYAKAWLVAHDIDHVVMYDIACTNARDLSTICLMCAAIGVDLTLFADGQGVPEGEIASLPASAVAGDASTVTHDGQRLPIPEPAQVAVRAQHLVRRSFGMRATEPFIDDSARHETRDVREQLNRMRSLVGTGIRLRYTTKDPVHWEYRNGIHLTDVSAFA